MHLTFDPRTQQHALHDPADLTSLSLVVPTADDLPLAPDALPPALGEVAEGGTHVLLDCDALRVLAGDLAADPSWQAGYDSMLAYAARQGWLTPDGRAVRAHCAAAAGGTAVTST